MTFSLKIKTAQEQAVEASAAVQAQISAAINAIIEKQARSLGYNSATTCVGYSDSTVSSWADEARAFIGWRDDVWKASFDLYAQAKEVPTIETLIAELPTFGA